MDKAAILADLRAQFGESRSTLYANELAQVMGKSTKAIYNLKDRDGLPVPVLPGSGRPCVSIHAVVDWLAGDSKPAAPTKKAADDFPPVPPPKRQRESMAAYLSTLRGQMTDLRNQIDFINDFHSELERIEIEAEAEEGKKTSTGAEVRA